jgi:hypothetical protein
MTTAAALDLSADCPRSQLYQRIIGLVPEVSGANHLQRIALARSAIACPINKAFPLEPAAPANHLTEFPWHQNTTNSKPLT